MTMRKLESPRPRAADNERGFTLPELMVAMVLTLVATSLTFSALQNANRTTESVMAMADVNQNLRVAMNVLIRDLLSTGEGIPIGGIAFPTGGTTVIRPGPPTADWHFDPDWTTLPAVSPGNELGTTVNGVKTDVVTLLTADRRLDLTNVTLTNISTNGSSITLPSSVDLTDESTAIVAGDLIMLTNANGNTLQEVTSVAGQVINFAASADSNLNQPTAPEGSVVDLKNDPDEDSVWPPTTITRIKMISYYIFVPTSGQITSPHLIRRVNYGDELVVAIGVTNVQLTWDLVDGVSNPINISDPGPTAADPTNANTEHQIRKANLFMAARSLETQTQTGEFVYSSLSTTVSLRSLAFVSRYDLQ
jgi:prepilin-type N-terminal cleavage/methylation domain-containing protein